LRTATERGVLSVATSASFACRNWFNADAREKHPRSAHREKHVTESPAGIESLIRRFYEQLWNRWDDAAVDGILAPQFQFRGSLGDVVDGRDEWRAYRDKIRAGSSDFHNELVELIVEGDRAAARLSYSGTHDGPLLGAPATGRRFTYAGAAFFTAGDGRLIAAWVLGDLMSLAGQLSAGQTG
jgi:predicted ester cyclase